MAVTLTISETLDGTAIADSLATGGPAQTGMDLGSVSLIVLAAAGIIGILYLAFK